MFADLITPPVTLSRQQADLSTPVGCGYPQHGLACDQGIALVWIKIRYGSQQAGFATAGNPGQVLPPARPAHSRRKA